MKKHLKTPVLLIAYNRLELIKQVLSILQEVRPKRLYIALDGPKKGSVKDVLACQCVKGLIKNIDWQCDIRTLSQKKNVGSKYGPYKAMKWFFKHEDNGIILEDDILPDKSFFYYCEDLLEKYKDDKRVGSISGNNFTDIRAFPYSYFFSTYSQTWGWATWKRVWKQYDIELKKWPTYKKENLLSKIFDNRMSILYWNLIFDAVYRGEINTAWDYQWTCMNWVHKYLTIIPGRNLAVNIGIGVQGATHTRMKNKFSDFLTYEMKFPLIHPKTMTINTVFDEYIQKNNYVLWKELGMNFIRKFSMLQRKIVGFTCS
jgi:hypothetical protein